MASSIDMNTFVESSLNQITTNEQQSNHRNLLKIEIDEIDVSTYVSVKSSESSMSTPHCLADHHSNLIQSSYSLHDPSLHNQFDPFNNEQIPEPLRQQLRQLSLQKSPSQYINHDNLLPNSYHSIVPSTPPKSEPLTPSNDVLSSPQSSNLLYFSEADFGKIQI